MKKTKGTPKSPKHPPDEVTEFAFDAPEMPTLVAPGEEPEKAIKPIPRGKVSKKIVTRLIEAVERL